MIPGVICECCEDGPLFCIDPSHVKVVFNSQHKSFEYDSNEDATVVRDAVLDGYSMRLTRHGIEYDSVTGDGCYSGQIFSENEGYIYLLTLSSSTITLRKYMAGPFGSVILFEGDLPPNWKGGTILITNERGMGNPGATLTLDLLAGDIGVRGYVDGGGYTAEFKTAENSSPDNLSQVVDTAAAVFYSPEIFFVADQKVTSDWPYPNTPDPNTYSMGYAFLYDFTDLLFYDVLYQEWIRYTDCPVDTEWGPLEQIGPFSTGYYEKLGGGPTGFNITHQAECEGALGEINKTTMLTGVAY